MDVMLLLESKVTKNAGVAIPPRPQTRNMYHIALQTAALPLTSVRNAHKCYVYAGIYIFIIRRGATPSPFHLSSVGDDAHIVPFCYSLNPNLPNKHKQKARLYFTAWLKLFYNICIIVNRYLLTYYFLHFSTNTLNSSR